MIQWTLRASVFTAELNSLRALLAGFSHAPTAGVLVRLKIVCSPLTLLGMLGRIPQAGGVENSSATQEDGDDAKTGPDPPNFFEFSGQKD